MKLIIGILSSLIAAAIIAFFGYLIVKPPSVTVRVDTSKTQINNAPFEVPIVGTVSRAKKKYLYLVVNDGEADWIEPGLGYGYDGEFYGTAYLGIKDDSASINKAYSVFGVITKQEYEKYEHLDRKNVLAMSETIRVRRTR